MTDLLRVLPDFPIARHAALIPTLETHDVSVTDLLTLDAAEIGKRTRLPLLEIQGLSSAILDALHADLGVAEPGKGDVSRQRKAKDELLSHGGEDDNDSRGEDDRPTAGSNPKIATQDESTPPKKSLLQHTVSSLKATQSLVSTLDADLDRALGGGIPTGYTTEIVGESGAGKTQFLLTLLLAAQLPPPVGLGRPSLYISTEAPLSTPRLHHLLSRHPRLSRLPQDHRNALLDGILSAATPDLESQEHILTYQVPVEAARRDVGLLVLDSVAANYRAEYAGTQRGQMAARSADLTRLGMLLRGLATRHGMAVVVANQVADRFDAPMPPPSLPVRLSQPSPLAGRGTPPVEPPSSGPESGGGDGPAALLLDHQQRWFTGWGDAPGEGGEGGLKTPSLGLVWTSQLGMRVALLKKPAYGRSRHQNDEDGEPVVRGWRRWMKVVFAPHVTATDPGSEVEFKIEMGGLRAKTKNEEAGE
jgi:DNA repair protein RAD57